MSHPMLVGLEAQLIGLALTMIFGICPRYAKMGLAVTISMYKIW